MTEIGELLKHQEELLASAELVKLNDDLRAANRVLLATVRMFDRQLIETRNALEDKCEELAEERRRRRELESSARHFP